MINSRKINYEESKSNYKIDNITTRGDPINMKRDTYIRKKQSNIINVNQSMMEAEIKNLDGSHSSETSFHHLQSS